MKNIFFLFFFVGLMGVNAQKMPVTYQFGEKYNDRHKYSNLLSISDDGKGGSVLVRAYYAGLVLKPKGIFIEHYNENLELISEYNYKVRNVKFVESYVQNGQIYMLFLQYNEEAIAYEYVVHRTPISDYQFTVEKLLTIPSEWVQDPYDRNYYNRDFNKGFTTTALFNKDKSAFVISTHFKRRKVNKHYIHMFRSDLQKVFEQDFSGEIEEKNYAFENVAFNDELTAAYIIGKAYFKKRRFAVDDRRFQYELVKVSGAGTATQSFDETGKYSESLIPIMKGSKLLCVGFYADRKDNRYNGLSYFEVNPVALNLETTKYNPFPEQFMIDKFGREDDKTIKDLVFKNVHFTDDGSLMFNAEEYFITTSMQETGAGSRVKIERYHYNDMVGAKLDKEGNLIWARNINKAEVTQNDGAYASYSSLAKGDDTYFFICTAADNPQLINNQRLIFKQGLTRNRNVFLIKLDGNGKMEYEKIIDGQEARLPFMVSKPLIDLQNNDLIFYAKRGSKKQLVKVVL